MSSRLETRPLTLRNRSEALMAKRAVDLALGDTEPTVENIKYFIVQAHLGIIIEGLFDTVDCNVQLDDMPGKEFVRDALRNLAHSTPNKKDWGGHHDQMQAATMVGEMYDIPTPRAINPKHMKSFYGEYSPEPLGPNFDKDRTIELIRPIPTQTPTDS